MNTIDINKHLKGLKCFKGTFARDLIPKIKYNERPIAFVINTDPSTKPGEHWVALFVTENNMAEYFDSFGRKPIKEINKLLKANNINNLIYNNTIIQCLFSSNCGLYCILFIKSRCNSIKYTQFLNIYNNNQCINDLITINSR